MSAIFGLLYTDAQPVSPDDLGRMEQALQGFGQDTTGLWHDKHVGLGCCLMHFTPEDCFEQQPLISADKQVVLVSDARIDNREELTHHLDIPPSELNEMPDSVFIMRAYEKWGEDCFNRLIGDYAIALWDAGEQRLLLARSPVGGRPLFYHVAPNSFVFATMPQGLFALPFIPRELDLEFVADYLTLAPKASGRSFFLGIRRLHAGQLLAIKRDGCKLSKFWQPDLQREIRYARDDDYVDAFNALFERVVADHLRSKTPIGVMMSGGLDSTSVAATAALLCKRENKRLATFTEVPRFGFDGAIIKGRYADETPFVQAMGRLHNNLELNFIRTGGRVYLDELDRFFDVSAMPFRNASNRVWFEAIVQEARKQGVRVLLTGEKGNLTISRDGQGLLPQLVRTGKWCRALQEASALRQNGMVSAVRTLVGQGIMPLLPTPLWSAILRMRGRAPSSTGRYRWESYSAINPVFALAQRVNERARKKGGDFRFRPNPDMRLTCGKMLSGMTGQGNNILPAYRAMYGLELRDPTADIRIVEFCLAMPEEQYLKDGLSRRLIRRSMADRLPPEVLVNSKRGLQAADWFERLSGAKEQILCELSEWRQSDLLSGVLDLERLYRLAERMPQINGTADEILRDYRQVLDSGMMMGRFIRWFETGGRQA